MPDDLTLLSSELAKREMARRWYAEYLPYVHGKTWKKTRMSRYLASQVQAFLEEDTGHAYDILVIETPPQHGKLVRDEELVPTPTGWKRHGDLKPGDYVFSPSGRPIKVLAEIPQPEPASLVVSFTDGAKITVHPNHEWVVSDKNCRGKTKIYETHEMLERGLHIGPKGRGGRYRFSVPSNPVIQYPEARQTLHPYFLGLWLGDGSTTKPCITHSPKDKEPIQHLVELGYPVSTECVHATTGVVTTYFYGRGCEELKTLGFGFRKGLGKYIPDCYKFASVEQRLQLLAGMIDSDGYVYQKNGRVTISNINRELIDDFAEVVRSLGWRATISAADPVCSTSGVQAKHVCYQLTFNPDMDIPVQIPRKRLTHLRPKRRSRGIVSIEPCDPVHGKCITVEGGVYLVGDHFTPTHNSLTLTESLPSWILGKWPEKRIILGSYNDETAERFCRRNKEKVTAFGEKLFNIQIGRINRATEFELEGHLGRLISRGIMGGVTGNPADIMIIDDGIKNRSEADSPSYRSKLWDEWQNSFKSRLAAHAKVIVIGTPWHEADYMATMLQTEDNIRLIRLPVEAEENDPLGRAVGEPLCPELGKDKTWLEQFKKSYMSDPEGGQRAWTALYQCSPRVEGGNLVQRSWWRMYNPKDVTAFATEVISVDAAFKDADSNDFVAITVWGKLGNDYYLRYCLNRHLDFTSTLAAIRQVKTLYPNAGSVLIEDKANGSAIINVLQKEMFCIPVNPKGGKVARVNAVSAAIESGHVYVPEDAPWLSEYLDQWSAFPAGAHDDMVDSSSQALSYLLYSNGTTGVIADAKQLRLEESLEQEKEAFLSEGIYDVYGQNSDIY